MQTTNPVIYSPSKLSLLESCPSFQSPPLESEKSQAAEEGTALHAAVETGDIKTLTDDQKELVTACQGYLSGIPGTHKREAKLMATLYQGVVLRGTLDVFSLDGTHAYVVDWKFGEHPVEGAGSNIQLQAYALLVQMNYPTVKAIHVSVVQPRLQLVTQHTYIPDDMVGIQARIEKIVMMAESNERLMRPSWPACRWCFNKISCPAIKPLLPASTDDQFPAITKDDLAQWDSPEVRAKRQKLAKFLEDYAEATRKANAEFVAKGGEIPGFQLVSGRPRQSVAKGCEADIWDLVKERLDLEDAQLLDIVSIRLPDLVALIKKHTQEEDQAQALINDMQPWISTSESTPYLKPSTKGKKNG